MLCAVLLPVVARAESAPDDPVRAKAPGERDHFGRIERPAPATVEELEPKALNLQVGEQLVYDIRISGVPGGKAMLEVKKQEARGSDDGPLTWTVCLDTRSNRAVSLFYNVQDKVRSAIDVKGGFSRYFYMDKREGEVKSEERISMSYDIGNMEATYERMRGEQWRVHKVPLRTKVLDPLSALYYLRGLDLANLTKDSFYLPICADRRVWYTKIRVVGHSLETVGNLKDRECIKIEPDAEFKGLFERKGRIQIWLDVATGIPLKMTAEIPIGPAEAVLSEYKNAPLPFK